MVNVFRMTLLNMPIDDIPNSAYLATKATTRISKFRIFKVRILEQGR